MAFNVAIALFKKKKSLVENSHTFHGNITIIRIEEEAYVLCHTPEYHFQWIPPVGLANHDLSTIYLGVNQSVLP